MNAASTAALLSASAAVGTLLAKIVLVDRWSSLDCGDSRALVLDRLVVSALTLSVLALILGVGGLIGRSERRVWAALGVVIASVVAALILIPDALGGYRCGVLTP